VRTLCSCCTTSVWLKCVVVSVVVRMTHLHFLCCISLPFLSLSLYCYFYRYLPPLIYLFVVLRETPSAVSVMHLSPRRWCTRTRFECNWWKHHWSWWRREIERESRRTWTERSHSYQYDCSTKKVLDAPHTNICTLARACRRLRCAHDDGAVVKVVSERRATRSA